MKFEKWYDSNYKKLLYVPGILLVLSILYIGIFYAANDSIIYKDVSLTGGTSFTISTGFSTSELESALSQIYDDFSVRGISDGTGRQTQVIVTINSDDIEGVKGEIEKIIGIKLDNSNSSIEFTDSGLSNDFFKQLIVAIILAFFWMAAIVFVIFSRGLKTKIWIIIGNIVFAIFLGNYLLRWNPIVSGVIFLGFAFVFIRTYIKNSVPAFAVMLSAFADIIMTLAVVNLFGMKISTAGIVAFLMLIGYSVDTDIMLTTRILNKKEETNKVLKGALKTGMTMTITSFIAISTALIVVYPFGSVLNQIFTILLIGLSFDLFNTWITNASIIKWYAEVNL